MTNTEWEEFKNTRLVVQCDTEEKANNFLKECEKRGYTWSDGTNPTANNKWKNYESKTTYVCFGDALGYRSYDYFIKYHLECKRIDYELENIETETKIVDNGSRREFETGAVRDKKDGKGRFDLMPLSVVSSILNYDEIISYIDNFLKNNSTSYLYLAIKSFIEKSKAFPNYYTMLLEVAIHFEEGAKKYGEYNWQKGIPINSYIDSATRHYIKWCRGDKDERHDRAFVWNLMCCIWEVDYHKSKSTNTSSNIRAEENT